MLLVECSSSVQKFPVLLSGKCMMSLWCYSSRSQPSRTVWSEALSGNYFMLLNPCKISEFVETVGPQIHDLSLWPHFHVGVSRNGPPNHPFPDGIFPYQKPSGYWDSPWPWKAEASMYQMRVPFCGEMGVRSQRLVWWFAGGDCTIPNIYIYIHMYIYVYVYIYIWYMYIYIYMYMYIYIYVYIYIYILWIVICYTPIGESQYCLLASTSRLVYHGMTEGFEHCSGATRGWIAGITSEGLWLGYD